LPRKKKTKQEKVFLSNAQIEDFKKDCEAIEALLKRAQDPKDHVGRKIQDPAELQKELSKKKKLLADHTPKKLRGQNANRLLKEARDLGEFIKTQMPKVSEYYQRYPKAEDGHTKESDFEKVVAQQVKFQTDPKIVHAVNRYKSIMRRIDPDDPTISNIERLRDR